MFKPRRSPARELLAHGARAVLRGVVDPVPAIVAYLAVERVHGEEAQVARIVVAVAARTHGRPDARGADIQKLERALPGGLTGARARQHTATRAAPSAERSRMILGRTFKVPVQNRSTPPSTAAALKFVSDMVAKPVVAIPMKATFDDAVVLTVHTGRIGVVGREVGLILTSRTSGAARDVQNADTGRWVAVDTVAGESRIWSRAGMHRCVPCFR